MAETLPADTRHKYRHHRKNAITHTIAGPSTIALALALSAATDINRHVIAVLFGLGVAGVAYAIDYAVKARKMTKNNHLILTDKHADRFMEDLAAATLTGGPRAARRRIVDLPGDVFHIRFIIGALPRAAATAAHTAAPGNIHLAFPQFGPDARPADYYSGRLLAAALNRDEETIDALVAAATKEIGALHPLAALTMAGNILDPIIGFYHAALTTPDAFKCDCGRHP